MKPLDEVIACKKCGEKKQLRLFSKRESCYTGRTTTCIACSTKRAKELVELKKKNEWWHF